MALAVTSSPVDRDDPLAVAWSTLLDRWDDDAGHKAFVALATSLQRLPEAARRYRALVDDPSRGARAKRGVDAVLAAAMATMTPRVRQPVRPIHVGVPLTALAMLFLVTMLAAKATGVTALTSPVVFVGEVLVVMLVPWRRVTVRRSQGDA
jgi:hypothetical protein